MNHKKIGALILASSLSTSIISQPLNVQALENKDIEIIQMNKDKQDIEIIQTNDVESEIKSEEKKEILNENKEIINNFSKDYNDDKSDDKSNDTIEENINEIKIDSEDKKNEKKSDQVIHISDTNLKTELNKILGNSHDNDITKEQLEKINGILQLSGKGIVNIDGLQYCTNVSYIILSDNEISNIDILSTANLPMLQSLNLSNNRLSNIDGLATANLPMLNDLNLSNNEISNINGLSTAKLQNLRKLLLGGNKISNIDGLSTANLAILDFLDLSNNEISNIDTLSIANLPMLSYLRLTSNKIRNIDGLATANLLMLQALELGDNKISNIDILSAVNLPMLISLELYNNKISDIEVLATANLPMLDSLSLSNNEISNIEVLATANLPVLTSLELSNNKISNIEGLRNIPSSIIDVSNQEIKDKYVEIDKRNVELENIITNIDGSKVSPRLISLGGKYDEITNKVIWNDLSNGINTLEYEFSENINISNRTSIVFSGRVNKEVLVKVNSYQANFDSQGGSAVAPERVDFEGLINKPKDPTREGYTFGGWYTDNTFATEWDFDNDKMPAKDITLYAKWTINSYQANFDSQGGSAVAPERVDFEGLINKPKDPTREGYTFGGWYTDNTFATEWNFDNDKMPAKDITLYAKWTINSYQANFDSQGGSAVAPERVDFEGLINKPKDPTREGYTFGGWYTDNTFATEWNFDNDKMPAKDITLYAKWILNIETINKVPTIIASDKVIILGEEFNPLSDVTAHDEEDGDITSKIRVISNNININKLGIYEVVYEVEDSKGAKTIKKVFVKVVKKDSEGVIPNLQEPTLNDSTGQSNTINKLPNTGTAISLDFVGVLSTLLGIVLLKSKKKKY